MRVTTMSCARKELWVRFEDHVTRLEYPESRTHESSRWRSPCAASMIRSIPVTGTVGASWGEYQLKSWMMSWSNLTFTLVTLDVNVSSDLGPGVDIVEMISVGPSSRELSSAVLLCDDMFNVEKWVYKDVLAMREEEKSWSRVSDRNVKLTRVKETGPECPEWVV